MKLRISNMTAGLAAGVTAAVIAACGSAAYLYSSHHFGTLLEDARRSAIAEGDLMRVALEHQMMENDRTLIARMVESFGKQRRVERLLVLDRQGVKRYSAGSDVPAADLALGSPTCQACHRDPPDRRGD